MIWEFPLSVPRHAFTVRDVARAGDVWRCLQEVAVTGSAKAGWHPMRYRAAGSAFVVRSMRVVHEQEIRYGEELNAQTWVGSFRRGLLTRREIRLHGPRGGIVQASQEWVHVNNALRLVRASQELIDALQPVDGEAPPEFPSWEAGPAGQERVFSFEPWHTTMDPLGHANHPAYVDWCDEAISRRMHATGIAPSSLRPFAEEISWKTGVEAGESVQVRWRLVGVDALGASVIQAAIHKGDGTLAATATVVRGLAEGGHEALSSALL